MEPHSWQVFLYSVGAVIPLVVGAIKYFVGQFHRIVSKEEILRMIDEKLELSELRIELVSNQISRVEDKLDKLVDMLINGQFKEDDEKGKKK